MSQQELLKKVISILDENKISYMMTGSIVSSLQGEPRATHDIDIIVALRKSDVEKFFNSLKNLGVYVDEESIYSAVSNKDMFNIIDEKEGDKIDFWMITNDPFDLERFKRRYGEEIFEMKVMVSSPEDTILAKLRWAKLCGGSEKQFGDALRVYEMQYENLDIDYIKRWIRELRLENLWKKLKEKAEI